VPSTRRLGLLLVALLVGCAVEERRDPPAGDPAPARARSAPVVLLTDFGLKDDAVGLLRGVILSIAPDAPVVDLCHEVPGFDVAAGARLLQDAPGLYPAGSAFVVVVDPGVGTARRAIAARLANGSFLVGPDNGVLTAALDRHGPAEVRRITNARWLRGDVSSTFHGRDVFAPVAAHLARGEPFEELGPVVEGWQRLDLPKAKREGDALAGVVTALDLPWGNVWTNIPAALLDELAPVGAMVEVVVGEATLTARRVATFGDVAEGQPLVYVNSRGDVALALHMGDFAGAHRVTRDQPVRLRVAR
jgi:S-adenosylmethionine hydrolase